MSALLVIMAATFGAATAAFLPHLACRLAVPYGSPSRSTCGSGWVRLRFPQRYGVTPVIGAVVATLLAVGVEESPLLPVYLLAAVPALLLAMIDLRCLRLPDRIVALLGAVAGVPLAVLRPEHIGTAVMAGGLVFAAHLAIALLPRGGLGLGDVKLAGVLAFVLGFAGWPAVAVGVLTPHLINGPIALALLLTGRADRRRPLPFGPALLAGALIAVITSPP
ncbi:prepilin peptidase [Paractinoplanes deccanensis]|uniref:Prepilin peptidase n=1 Tax=Paractinoplanes deccanensis TaxID=113561 RepID=A0ABQ3YGS5_9ACTN|nr:prepilin peptidase [Actinoplanes deccanensis]GID78990.1 prepilin peptidase [Actinoplanes deccanensis]